MSHPSLLQLSVQEKGILVLIISGIHIVDFPAMGVAFVDSLVAIMLCIVDSLQDDRIQYLGFCSADSWILVLFLK